jgi:hypothetical protein
LTQRAHQLEAVAIAKTQVENGVYCTRISGHKVGVKRLV